MKKILFALVVAAGIFCLASCKNNQTEVAEPEAVEAVEAVDSTVNVAVDSAAVETPAETAEVAE